MRELKISELAEKGEEANENDEEEEERDIAENRRRNGCEVFLEEIFYVSSKRTSNYRVRLHESGLTLRKESSYGVSKSECIATEDIIGCHCLRATKRDKEQLSCVCTPGSVLKKRAKRRDRMTITLRFRSFDKYEDNLREAMRWKLAIKCLCAKLQVPRAFMSPNHRNLQTLVAGKIIKFFF